MSVDRRSLVLALAAGVSATLVAGCTSAAQPGGAPQPGAPAANFPTKPIEMIVPYPPGGATDVLCRTLADAMGEPIGQKVLVVNKAGAGGVTGSAEVAKARADGHTILCSANGVYLQTALRKVPFTMDDFVAVGAIGRQAQVVVASPNSGISSIADLKAKGSAVKYATSGSGNLQHLLQAATYSQLGVEAIEVPFDGAAPALQALLGNQVDLALLDASSVLPQLGSGIKPLLILSSEEKAIAELGDVPMAKAEGVNLDPGVIPMWGVTAPSKVSPEVLTILRDAMAEAKKSEALTTAMATHKVDLDAATDPAQWYEEARATAATAKDAFAKAGVKLEGQG